MTNETTTVETVKTKRNEAALVREYEKANPKAKPKDVAAALGISVQRVYQTHNFDQKKKSRAKLKKRSALALKKATLAGHRAHPVTGKLLMQAAPAPDNVNHPAHYKVGGIETIDFIEAKQLNYNLGNVVKYITRADHKGNNIEDLQKARWYLNREIANHTGAKR